MSTIAEPAATPGAEAAPGRLAFLVDHPVRAAVLGAAAIATSAVLVRLAGVRPETAAFYRCLYALPVLVPLARREDRRLGPRTRESRRLAALAGLFFAADLVLWHHAIDAVGAGLATVLGNLQVLVVAFAAWALYGERPHRRYVAALPVLLTGVVLVSGAVGEGAYGEDPLLGVVFGIATSVAYAGFLLALRRSGRDLRRPAGPLCDATAVAAAGALLVALVTDPGDLAPSWPAHGWLLLLGVGVQVGGWLLISLSLPRLTAALTSTLLLLQPVGSMTLAAATLGEAPSAAQVAGCVLLLGGIVAATARRADAPAGG